MFFLFFLTILLARLTFSNRRLFFDIFAFFLWAFCIAINFIICITIVRSIIIVVSIVCSFFAFFISAFFVFAFFVFAHNLMEAMALMVISGVYATLPLYLADGTRKLYSNKLANLALWILLLTSFSSFLHHFITLFPNLPATLAYHGNIMSWGTGIGAALTIFTITATAWKHGLRMNPGLLACLLGFVLYILDGASAVVTSNVAWAFQLHGTMWQSGHTMTVVLAMALMWMGILYHHYPIMTGRMLDDRKGYWFIGLFSVGATASALVMLFGGADGMPRRHADWAQGGWMVWGDLILLFSIPLILGAVYYAANMMKSRQAGAASTSPAPAE